MDHLTVVYIIYNLSEYQSINGCTVLYSIITNCFNTNKDSQFIFFIDTCNGKMIHLVLYSMEVR